MSSLQKLKFAIDRYEKEILPSIKEKAYLVAYNGLYLSLHDLDDVKQIDLNATLGSYVIGLKARFKRLYIYLEKEDEHWIRYFVDRIEERIHLVGIAVD